MHGTHFQKHNHISMHVSSMKRWTKRRQPFLDCGSFMGAGYNLQVALIRMVNHGHAEGHHGHFVLKGL